MSVGAIETKIQKVVTQKVEKLFFHAFTLTLKGILNVNFAQSK